MHQQKKIVTISERAAARMRMIMDQADEPYLGVRVGVKNSGCAGMEYTLEYAHEASKLDEIVEDQGITLLIDSKAVLFLLGAEVDYVEEKLSSRFVFKNPNQTDACGCGESVTIVPVSKDAMLIHGA